MFQGTPIWAFDWGKEERENGESWRNYKCGECRDSSASRLGKSGVHFSYITQHSSSLRFSCAIWYIFFPFSFCVLAMNFDVIVYFLGFFQLEYLCVFGNFLNTNFLSNCWWLLCIYWRTSAIRKLFANCYLWRGWLRGYNFDLEIEILFSGRGKGVVWALFVFIGFDGSLCFSCFEVIL